MLKYEQAMLLQKLEYERILNQTDKEAEHEEKLDIVKNIERRRLIDERNDNSGEEKCLPTDAQPRVHPIVDDKARLGHFWNV